MATQAAVGGASRSMWLLARQRGVGRAVACADAGARSTRLPGAGVAARTHATHSHRAVVASRRHVTPPHAVRALPVRLLGSPVTSAGGGATRAVHASAACAQRARDGVARGGASRGDAPSRGGRSGREGPGPGDSDALVYPIPLDTAVRPAQRRREAAVGASVDADGDDGLATRRGKRQVVKRPRYRHDPPGFHRDRKGRLVEDVLFPVDDGERLLCRRISEVALPSDVMDLVHSEADDAGLHAATTGLQRLSQLMAAPQHTLSRRKLAKIRAHAASAEDVQELCLLATEHLRVYLPAVEESVGQEGGAGVPAVGPRTLSSLVWAAAKLGYQHTTLYDLALAHAELTGLDKFTPRDISQLVNGLSRSPLSAKRRRDFLCDNLVPAITRSAEDFHTNELSNLLCSFAATPLPAAPGQPGDVPERKFFAFDPADHGEAGQAQAQGDAAAGGGGGGADGDAPAGLAAQRAAVGSMALALGARAIKSLAEARQAATGADAVEAPPPGNYNGRRMPRKRAPPPPPPPSAQAVCNTVYGLARLRPCAEDAVRARVVDGLRMEASARDGPDPGASVVEDREPRSVYELLQELQEEVLTAIGTGRGKLDASPLGVMQAVWAYVDAAEAQLDALEKAGTPRRPSEVLNALVLRKACKAFALYHCNSAAARQSPHVVVAMLGAMDRVKSLVTRELAADKQAAVDAAAAKKTLLVAPPRPESDLARLFSTSEDRTGAAVRLWYAAGCSADEFVDRLDATNLSVLVRCLQSLAPADAARTGTQRRALALPPHEAFGGVFAKVGFRAAELVEELPNRGLAVLLNIYAQHGGKAGHALFQAVMESQQAQTRITRLSAQRMTDVVHSLATGPQPRTAAGREQRWHLLRGIGARLSARVTELDRTGLADAIQALGMCHEEVDVFTLTAARAAATYADKLDRRRAAAWLGRVVPGLVDLGLHVPVLGGGVPDGDAGTLDSGSAQGRDARTAGVAERLVPGSVLFPTPVRSAASSLLVPTASGSEREPRDGREARRNRLPLAETLATSAGYGALDELARVASQRLEDGGFDEQPEALCQILRSVAVAGLAGGITPHGLELLQQAFYSSLQSTSGAERWADALTRALVLGNTGTTDRGMLPPRFEAPLASLFVAHTLWGHWMRSVDHAERAAVTTSRTGAGALGSLLRFGRGALERQELAAAAAPARRQFVSSVVGALEGTNARMVTGALSAPTGTAVDVAIAVGGEFDDVDAVLGAGSRATAAGGHTPRFIDPTAVGQAVALQVGDAGKFLGGSRMPRPAAQAQCAMLHADGWLVVPVPAWEWLSLMQAPDSSPVDLQRFLHSKIQRQLLRVTVDEADAAHSSSY